MAIDIPLELDSGPITWVKAEIDSALLRALANIDKLRSDPTVALQAAIRSDLHQVSGAFELVGIEGLAVLVQEFEQHFSVDSEGVPAEALDLVDRGCRRLLSHLKEMVSGSPPVPLKFIVEYLALGKLRRSKYGPADLFFPDLSRRPAKLVEVEPPEQSRMPAFLLRQRRDFQQGLLVWLRGSEAGLEQMRSAVAQIEAAYPLPSQRSFWWATHALLVAAQDGLIESSTALKQLMARVDLQVRRFVEGSTRVADRLRREVLYQVARAQAGHPLVDSVKALYELDVLVPKRIAREIDVVALQPAVDALSTMLTRCKDAWSSLSAGRSNALARLRESVHGLPAACDELHMPDFSSLGRSIASAAASVTESKSISDDLSIEFATSLILFETALEHIAALPVSFHTQVDRAVQRLSYATSNAPIPAELRAEVEANSLTRLAQEKQTIAQVAREIRINMRLVEQALDTVFRDRTAVEELKPVPALLGQVSGAMRMLGWNDANELLTKTSDRLIELVRRDATLSTQEIDSLADVLAGLSFYVDVRERRDQDADAILAGLTRRFSGEVELEIADSDDSVEASIVERQRLLRPLARAISDEPDSAELRDTLRSTLQGVRQDAELLSDPSLSAASNEALRLLDNTSTPSEALTAAVAAVVGGSTRLPPTSMETSRLVDSRQDEQDTALLEIFVEEAIEVVAAVRAQHAELSVHHDRRDVLVDTRRAFHTLKGSGRMVGQTDLAEVAWRVENVLNNALETDRSVNEPEIKLIGAAAEHFTAWVEELRTQNHVQLDVSILDDLIASCAPRISVGGANLAAPAAAKPVTPDASMTLVAPIAFPAIEVDVVELSGAELDLLLADAVATPQVNKAAEAPLDISLLQGAPFGAAAVDAVDLASPEFEFDLNLAGSDDVEVLGVSVSRALFSILTDETRVHLQTLDYELTLMQFDSGQSPSDSMVRASHTLCGIHRTAGFLEIGDFAGLVETVLMAIRRTGRIASVGSVLASAIQSLRTATLRLQAQSPMSPEEITHFEYSRNQLLAIIAETGNVGLRVETELLEQTQAEEQALELPIETLAVDAVAPLAAVTVNEASAAAPLALPIADTAELDSVGEAAVALAIAEPAPVDVVADVETMPVHLEASAAQATPLIDSPLPSAGLVIANTHADHSALAMEPLERAEPPIETPTVAAKSTALAQEPSSVVAETAILPVVITPAATAVFAALISPSATSAMAANVVVANPPPPVAAPIVAPRVVPPPPPSIESRTIARSAEDPLVDIRDDIDEQVLPIFIEEAQELFPTASAQVNAWRSDVRNPVHSDGLKRTLHTLKGSARMAGAMRLGEVAHSLETRLLDVADAPESATFDSFDEYLDDIAFLLERLTRGEKDVVLPRFAASALAAAQAIESERELAELARPAEPAEATLAAANEALTSDLDSRVVAAPRSLTEVARSLAIRPTVVAAPLAAEVGAAFLRVRSDAVEQLADEAGEISIHRSRIEAEMRNLKAGLLDLTASVVRLRGQLREIEIQGESQIQSRLDQESEFDPLEFDRYTRFQELTRGLAEGVNDVATVQQSLLKNLADADIALLTQTRLSRSVQLRLQTLRTVPFSNVSDRLYRLLRQTAKELGKRANLDIQGGRIEIDRSVLERLAPVLEHLVRNALAHGIESEQSRLAIGKPGIGELTLSARQQGNEVAISLVDDGGGIPLDKVRNRAVALGLIAAGDDTTDGQLVEFIFQPGFSTAEQVTAVAGRGIGMDVVRSEVAALGGRVEVHTVSGVSTSFTLSVPLTLAVTQVLLVRVGKAVFGIPSSLISQVRQVPAKERAAAVASGLLDHGGSQLEFRSLGSLMRISHDVDAQRNAPVIVLRAGDSMAAVEVDRIISNQEVVAKPYGPQLARVPGLAGLTVLANGTIALLINPLNLILAREPDVSRRVAAVLPVVATANPLPAVTDTPAPEAVVAELAVDQVSVTEAAPSAPAAAIVPPWGAAQPPSTQGAAIPAIAPTLAPAAISAPMVTIDASAASAYVPPEPVLMEVEARVPVVLVVDDSLTVRKFTTRLLEREGYKALTAKDGLDALQILSDANPDVILLDIEMPRMDGFEFTKTIKADNRQSHIPIIMITSRTAEKHRNHAMELGVNEYLGKPYQDEQLMALVVKYAGKPS
ncbi:MAG: Hpt domain-containing protein [Rhizobacter sp.]|nr:Hpt domain-containing protein [Burkholderiales bacterium]